MNKFRNKSGNDLSRRGEGLLNGVDLSPRNRLQSLAIGCAVLILQFEDRTKKSHILSSVLMKIQKRLKVYTCIISLIFFYSVSVSHLIHEYKKFTISMFLYFFLLYFTNCCESISTMKFYLAFICLLVIVWTKGKLRHLFCVIFTSGYFY